MPETDQILTEESRTKLDGIVERMITNKESDEAIRAVVDDFKSKYAVKKKDESGLSGGESTSKIPEVVSPSPSQKPLDITPIGDVSQIQDPNNPIQQLPKAYQQVLKLEGIDRLKSLPELAQEDTDKYFGDIPTPPKKIQAFNQSMEILSKKFTESIQNGGNPEQLKPIFDKEIESIAFKEGLNWDGQNATVPQNEIDKYNETYQRKLDERASKLAESKKNSYIKDAISWIGEATVGLAQLPIQGLAAAENLTNKIPGIGDNPANIWQNLNSHINEKKEQIAQESQRYDQDIMTYAQNGEMGKAIGKGVQGVVQMVPILIAAAAGNEIGAAEGVSTLLGLQSGLESYNALSEKNDIPEATKLMYATSMGLSNKFFMSEGVVNVMANVQKMVAEKEKNVVREEIFNAFNSPLQKTMGLIMGGNSEVSKNVGIGVAMQLSNNLIAKATINPQQDLSEGVIDQGITFGLLAKGVHISKMAGEYVQNRGNKKAIQGALEQIPEDYSVETKEKLVPLIIERDAISESIDGVAKPLQILAKERIRQIDEEALKISMKEEGQEIPPKEEPKEGEKPEPDVKPKPEVVVKMDEIKPISEEKKDVSQEEKNFQRMNEIEKALGENGYGVEIEADLDPNFSTVNVYIGNEIQDINNLPKGIKDLVDEFSRLSQENQVKTDTEIKSEPEVSLSKENAPASSKPVEKEKSAADIQYEESLAKKPQEVVDKMPTYKGKKFSLATIKPNGDISNVYVRNEGESHKTYMTPEDAKAYEEGRMTVGYFSPESGKFFEAPQKGFREYGQKVMDIAASKIELPKPKTEENAKGISGNESEVHPGGNEQEVGRNKSRPNLEQPAQKQPSNEKERLTLHNSLVDQVKDYNSRPDSHKKIKADIFKGINNLVQKLGYTISQKEGKLNVLKDGKKITKISQTRTKEELQSHKAINEYENKEFVDFVNTLSQTPENILGFYDTGIPKDKIAKAMDDIGKGNKNANSNDLLDHLESVFEKGEVVLYDAVTGTKIPIPIKDIIESIRGTEDISTIYDEKAINDMLDDYYEGRMTDQEWDQMKELFADNPEDFVSVKNNYNDGKQHREEESSSQAKDAGSNVETKGQVPPQENAAAKESRVKLDAEIADQEKLLKEAKERKNKKIAEFNNRNGMFGDVKNETEPPKLFETKTEFSQDNLNNFIRPELNEIARLEQKIAKLKANKEAKVKEASGQAKMEENAFAEQSKGKKKKTPPSKEKGITKPGQGRATGPEEKKTPPKGPWINEERMTNENLKGLEAPEIVDLYRKLSGKFPELKKFARKLGVFMHVEGGDFKIVLNKMLFTKEGRDMLAKVISHEVGHFIDSLPGIITKRGNLLGRIASLKEYFKKTLGEKPGKENILTEKDREYLRKEAERNLKEEYNKGIREIVEEIIKEEPIFEEAGLTAKDITDIWNSNNARETNPELYEYIAKLSSFQKKKIMADALKGLVDSELVRRFSKGRQIGTKITKELIRKTVTPKQVTPQEIAQKYRELLKDEINKRRLFEEEVIRRELEDLTQWRNPYDENLDPTYTEYRKSAVELYAEGVSELLIRPENLAERAPFFNRAFMNYFEKKPDIKAVFDELQGLLSKSRSELLMDRLNRVYEGFKRGKGLRAEIAKKKKVSQLSYWEKVQNQLLSEIIHIVKPIPENKQLTTALNDKQYLRDMLEKLASADEKVAVMLVKADRDIIEQLKEVGLSMDDFSALLMVNRQISQRTEIANPYAFQEKESAELKAFIEDKFSPEQKAVMERALQNFHNQVFDIVDHAYKVGMFTPEQYEYIEKFKDSYATFAVVDHIYQNNITAAFKHASGTLKEIESPFISTLFKMSSIIRGIERQNAVNAMIDMYAKYLPGEITKTKEVRRNGILVDFKPAEGKKTVEYWDNGKWSSIDVDPYIAEFFRQNKLPEMNFAIEAIHYFNKGFKPLVTTWNVGWAFFSNVFRDHPRTFYNLFSILASTEGVSKAEAAELPLSYLKSLIKVFPEAKKFVNGELTPMIEEMINQGVLRHGFFGSYDPHAEEATGPIFQRFGLISKDKSFREKAAEKSKILKAGLKILSGIEYAGQILEVSSKLTAFKLLQDKLGDARTAGFYTRNYAGTPNYLDKGTATRTTNEIFTFSNVILQSIRTDSEIAFKPQTRGAFWLSQAISVITPAALMSLGAAGMFGKELEDLYSQISEYEKTNYLCIIWGSTKDGKPIYTKLPITDFSRMIHGATYKTVSTALNDEGIDNPSNWLRIVPSILSMSSSMTPSPSPLLGTAVGWLSYASGQNPYDFFYGNNVLTDREQAQRETNPIPGFKKMTVWSMKKLGLTWAVKFFDYDPLKNSTQEYVLQNIPVVSRMIKIGGTGQAEMLSKAGKKYVSERAEEIASKDKIINKYVLKAISEGKDLTNSNDVLEQMKKEIYGSTSLNSEQKRSFSGDKKKFQTKIIKGIHSPFSHAVSAIINSESGMGAASMGEKIAKLQSYGLIYGEDKLAELIRYMHDQGIISKQFENKIKEMADGMDTDENKRNAIIQALQEKGEEEVIPSENINGEMMPVEEVK